MKDWPSETFNNQETLTIAVSNCLSYKKIRSDKFARLRAIAAGQEAATVKNWNYGRDGNVMETIVEFSGFNHQTYGEQQTVTVQLAMPIIKIVPHYS